MIPLSQTLQLIWQTKREPDKKVNSSAPMSLFFHILQLQRSVLKFTACYLVGRSCSEIISFIISTFSELDAFTLPKSKRHKVVVKNALADINQPLLDALNMSKQTQMVL